MSMFGSMKVVNTRDNIPPAPASLPVSTTEDGMSASVATSTASASAAAAPTPSPVAAGGPPDTTQLWNEGRDMSSAMSLRERMKAYQALRAETAAQQQAASLTSGSSPPEPSSATSVSDDNSFMPPGGAAAAGAAAATIPEEGTEGAVSRSMEPPDESWVPPPPAKDQDDAEDPDRAVVAGAAVTAAAVAASADDEYEEEEVEVFEDEDDNGTEEIVEDDDDDDEYEEVELGAVGNGDTDTIDEEQGVFDALDEAERADGDITYDEKPQQQERAMPSEPPVYKPKEEAAPQQDVAKNRCLIAGVLFVGAIAIAALVLPFVYDYPNRNPSGGPSGPTDAPSPTLSPGPPSPPSAPGPGDSPAPTENTEPTLAPTSLRFGQFLESFVIPISGSEVLEDETSPQFRAAFYISEEDPYTAELTSVEQLEDRYATITFYYATNGDNWNSCYFNDASCEDGEWLVNDVCLWAGVGCTEAGRISSIDFGTNNGLQGTLPLEMYLLADLTELLIANNTLTGTLPTAFGQNLTAMQTLALPSNQLSGSIPDDYLSNSPLSMVFLEDNQFGGSIPTNMGNLSLSMLDLSDNSFDGTIPEGISNYESLTVLDLSNNGLGGTISESIFTLSSLSRLHLNGNPISGPLSPLVRNLTRLEELRIGDSDMTGFLPDELILLRSLREIDVSGAAFEGQLPQGLGTLAETLRILKLEDNQFVGTVPAGFGLLTDLNVMELHFNGFTGSIADSICQLRGNTSSDLQVLTADCDEVSCPCCSECF